MMSVLPLRQAYLFAAEVGLEELDSIRSLPTKEGFPKMSGARRGLFIRILERKGLLDRFLENHWPEGLTDSGRRMLSIHRQRYDDYLEFPGLESTEDLTSDETDSSSFAYEADLQSFLAKNLAIIEPGLDLYSDTAGSGIEYPVDSGRIDLLAKDRDGRLVVIELKLSKGRNRALGQILYYMGWVDAHLSDKGPCRGIIVAREVSEELKLACGRTPGLELFEYTLQVTLKATPTLNSQSNLRLSPPIEDFRKHPPKVHWDSPQKSKERLDAARRTVARRKKKREAKNSE